MTTNTQWIQTRVLRFTKGGQDFDGSKQMSLCDWFDTVTGSDTEMKQRAEKV